jgi:hypothetical protein
MMDSDSRDAKRDKRSQLAIIAVQWWQWQVVVIAAILWLLVMVARCTWPLAIAVAGVGTVTVVGGDR